jgi:hypothetical protein
MTTYPQWFLVFLPRGGRISGKKHKSDIAAVIGLSPEFTSKTHDFSDQLAAAMNEHHLTMELVRWEDLDRNARYLEIALSINLHA